jgi:hypothetical protein
MPAETSALVYTSETGVPPCPHDDYVTDGCCDEHGGREDYCVDCGLPL